jgi:threonine/homoserine/homoserine lactone efflux protein
VGEVPALAIFSLISAGTPGPNNALLWASGLQFGFRRTVPQIGGTTFGIGLMAIAVAAGLGVFVAAVPEVELALKVVGSAYLVWLALQLAGSGALERRQLVRPLAFRQAVAFQFLNPKGWIFALAAVGTFRSDELPIVLGSAVVVVTMMVVVLPAAAVWAAAGSALHRLTEYRRANRADNIGLAVLIVCSVVFIWLLGRGSRRPQLADSAR